MRLLIGFLMTVFLMGQQLQAAEWRGGAGLNAWSFASNWSPANVPDSAGEVAEFAPASGTICAVTSTVAPSSVHLKSGYPGTVTVINGRINCDDLTVTSGTLVSAIDRVVVARNLLMEGGSATSVTCSGDATLLDGLLSVRMNGSASNLRGKESNIGSIAEVVALVQGLDDPTQVGTELRSLVVVPTNLEISAGQTNQTHLFAPAIYSLGGSVIHRVEEQSALILTNHNISGDIVLSQVSSLMFTNGATLQESVSIDASQSGTVVLCVGTWSMDGTFLNSGSAASTLIIQQFNGGTINHGSNGADIVVVNGGQGAVSTWTSSNAVQALTIPTGTTLQIAADAVLDVATIVANAGLIQIEAGGMLKTKGVAVMVTESGLPLPLLPAGDSIVVQLVDTDKNLDGSVAETVGSLTLTNTRNGDTVAVTGLENAPLSGIFRSLPVATVAGSDAVDDAILQVLSGDVIELNYTDPSDPADQSTASLTIIGSTDTGTVGWVF